jgi:hypothetical protein
MKKPKRHQELGQKIWQLENAVREAHDRCQTNILLKGSWLDQFLVELAGRMRPLALEATIMEADLQILPVDR